MNKYAKFLLFTGALGILQACHVPDTMPVEESQAIEVAKVLFEPTQRWHTFTSRLEAPEQVMLTPRVSGVIETVKFEEGSSVRAGEVLFTLDARPFTTQVANLEAQIASAQARLAQAQNEYSRAVSLAKDNAISAEELQARQSITQQQSAQIDALHAQLDAARLNLEFTSVVSPIDGIVSRANLTKGNQVIAGSSILTSIVSNDAMYAYIDIDERTWARHYSGTTNQQLLVAELQSISESQKTILGRIDFIDNSINPSTGTLRVRAVFNNEAADLKAGSFARIRVATRQTTDKVLVPEKSIGTDLANRYVLVLDQYSILQYKPVKLGNRYGHLRAIEEGLNSNDVIAINGPGRVGPGEKVRPNSVSIDDTNVVFSLTPGAEQLLVNIQRPQ